MKNFKTYLFFLDDHKAFSEDIRKKFDDPFRYVIQFVHSYEELFKAISKEKEKKHCKIAVIDMHDQSGKPETDTFLNSILGAGISGIILICAQDKLEEIIQTTHTRIDAIIPQNSNLILRIHNAAKKIISEHNIRLRKKRRDRSLIALLAFVMLALIALFIIWRRLPQHF
ncbi:MAG TPA: hypothetical protein VK213_02090 [Bacteroidales bacterium]|nr:hypothetical protein [Bacteroidales bacterium]